MDEKQAVAEEVEYSVKEAAEILHKHYVVVLNLIYSGYLRGIKKGGRWVVKSSELKRFQEEGNFVGEKEDKS